MSNWEGATSLWFSGLQEGLRQRLQPSICHTGVNETRLPLGCTRKHSRKVAARAGEYEQMPDEMFDDRPWGKGNNPMTAVNVFLKKNQRFKLDEEINNKI